jgi:cell wall assembly regulator SMI1
MVENVLTDWILKNAPEFSDEFGEAADSNDVAKVQSLLGESLPDSYISFLKKHDGFSEQIGMLEFLSLQYATSEYEDMQAADDNFEVCKDDVKGPVRPLCKNKLWWPIVLIGGASNYYCIDLDPAPSGKVGQVIEVTKDLTRQFVASSFDEFIEMITSCLSVADGEIELSEEFGDEN